MKLRSLLCSIFALVVAGGSAVAEDTKRCQDATAALRAGIYDLAIKNLTECLETGNLNTAKRAVAFMGRASAYLSIGEVDRAESDYEQAHNLDPTLSEMYLNEGAQLQSAGRIDEAIGLYNLALNLNPSSIAALLNRGGAYLKLQEYDLAQADYQWALSFNPNLADAHSGMGSVNFFKGDFDRAVQAYDTALQLDQRLSFVLRPRGLALFSVGNFDRARSDLERHLTTAPHDQFAVLWLYVTEARGNRPDAQQRLRDRTAGFDQNSGLGLITQMLLGSIGTKEVIEIVETAGSAANAQFRAVAWFFAGQQELIAGSKVDAKRMFEETTKSGVENVAIHARAELARL